MKTSYPFLVITKKYNLDYGQVCLAADYAKNFGPNQTGYKAFVSIPDAALREIQTVNSQFREMQAGTRDWMDGFEIP